MMSSNQYSTKDGKPDPEERAVQALRDLIRAARVDKTTGERTLKLTLKDGGITQLWREGRELI